MLHIRKSLLWRDTLTSELGQPAARAVTRAVAVAVIGNPCAGRYVEDLTELFEATVRFWRAWLSRCSYRGRWRETVHRSALVLKLLTFEPTGAIVAAPTCSLPEELGGVRNWDYRYTWIRDAAFTVYALLRIGFTQEAARFMDWLEARAHTPTGERPLQIVYGIDGRADLTERTLDHLAGYRGSRPVRCLSWSTCSRPEARRPPSDPRCSIRTVRPRRRRSRFPVWRRSGWTSSPLTASPSRG